MNNGSASPAKKLRVLIADDERIGRQTILRQLQEAGYVAVAVENAFQAIEKMGQNVFDVVLSDLRMPGMDGLEFLRAVKRDFPATDVIIMTAHGSVETAVGAMQLGAADYVTKPFRFPELALRLQKLQDLRNTRQEILALRAILDNHTACGGLVGRSAGMQQVFKLISVFSGHTAPALITGDTGTGKELVARALHSQGSRALGPFVPVACGAIPREIAESELFGHEKGAFTGAIQRRQGAFERAHGGTLFLDDVDDLPLDLQVKLLRVLQEGTFTRVGGGEEITVDVRILASTKVELEKAVQRGLFRDDLFYRLRGLEIHLPLLRDRGEDVLLLAHHFVALAATGEGGVRRTLLPETVKLLVRHSWPGNVRELRRAMEAAVVLCPDTEIGPACLPEYLRTIQENKAGGLFSLHLSQETNADFNQLVESFEDSLIQWAMQRAGGRQTVASEILSIPRTTLQSKLARGGGQK